MTGLGFHINIIVQCNRIGVGRKVPNLQVCSESQGNSGKTHPVGVIYFHGLFETLRGIFP